MRRRRSFCLIIYSGLLWVQAGQGTEFDHSHPLFATVLQKHVRNGLVDYSGLKTNPNDLQSYLNEMGEVKEEAFKKWSQPQQLAFLINLYNASVLKLIIDHYPVKSIKKIGGFFGQPWDVDVVPYFGQIATLGYLEHEVIQKNYREPRVHFALVCASSGCPDLRSEPYQPQILQEQLNDQARRFLNDLAKNRVDTRERRVYLSAIFKWYAEDFEHQSGSVLKFIEPYLPPDSQKALKQGGYKIRYTDYDWSLNDAGVRR